ncbi:paired mesoderm homeobox protein 2-like [Halichondria panicea]|uniref:paired mesoderm homeobox protein 2-like n=1 Tax=Halichondria panicea TaxID=6063 RepID=UPI00312BCA6D
MDGYKRAASASRNHSLNPRLMSKATGAKVMATSFSIQDILSKKDKRHESTSPTAPQAQASPESSPDSGPQVSVLNDSSLQFGESSSRKRNREGSDASGSGCSSEVFLSDSDSPGPVDLDALAALDCRRRTKRPRTAFTSSQLKGLEYYFRHCAYPDGNGRDVITRVTGVEDARIQVWFQNRRARYRKRELPLKKPSVSLTPPPQPPTPRPQLSPPPLTPGTPVSSIDSYYAAVMAYYMQAYQNGHPTYLPLPPGTLPTPPPQTSAMNEQSN